MADPKSRLTDAADNSDEAGAEAVKAAKKKLAADEKIAAAAATKAIKRAGARPPSTWAWEETLKWQAGGGLSREYSNVITVLSNHPEWEGVLAWDDFRHRVVSLKPPPWAAGFHGKRTWTTEDFWFGVPWTDLEYISTSTWFEQSVYKTSFAKDLLLDAVELAARQRSFHPVQTYLKSLAWDGQRRIDGWLRYYLGAAGDEQYLQSVGRYWLISAVARVMEPPVQVDHMIILEGAQGAGKTSALRALAGPEWFLSTLLAMDSKEIYMQLQGRWIVEFGELDALSKAEDKRQKQFLTEQYEEYIPKHQNNSVKQLRQCVFAGTVNEDTYLRDATGGRRYWPIKCTSIRVTDIAEDRDQLWAEAYDAWAGWTECAQLALKEQIILAEQNLKAAQERASWDGILAAGVHPLDAVREAAAAMDGARAAVAGALDVCRSKHDRCSEHRWWPTGTEEVALFGGEQAARLSEDVWEPIITRWLANLPDHRKNITTTEILSECLNVEPAHQKREHEMRIAGVLKSNGWARKRLRGNGSRAWQFIRPTNN